MKRILIQRCRHYVQHWGITCSRLIFVTGISSFSKRHKRVSRKSRHDLLALTLGRGTREPQATTLWPCARCRVRCRVLMVQEHQPLPSEPCWQFSLHTALQESLRRFSSEECMPDQRVSSRHILPGECWHDRPYRLGFASGSMRVEHD